MSGRPRTADCGARASPTIATGPLQISYSLHRAIRPSEARLKEGQVHRLSAAVTSVPPLVRNGSLVFRRSAYPDPWRRASPFQSPSDRLAPVPASASVARSPAHDVAAWSAPFRSMPASVRNTTESWSRRVRRQLRSPGNLPEPGRSTCASPHRSDSSRLPQTIERLRECRSHSAGARWRSRNRPWVSILPEPARKMRERNVSVRDLRMPFLLPLEGHETIVAELAQRSSNLGQRKIALPGKDWLPAIMILTQVFDMDVANACAEAGCAFLWPLLEFEETVRRVPNGSGLRTTGFRQNRRGLGCGGKVTVGFQPDFNPFWAGVLDKLADGVGNPASRRGPVRAGLDRVPENPQAGRTQGSCQVGHALAFREPPRALMGIG